MDGKGDPASPSSKPASVRQRVQIRVEYAGKGQPGPHLAQRCDLLVSLLVERDAGVIEPRKVGDGAVDVFVVTRFAEHTIVTARSILVELGIADRSTVKLAERRGES
jgi:hypothetical protein